MKTEKVKETDTQHTPGPWQYDIAAPGYSIRNHEQAVIIGPDGYTIASTTEADARLIAAAPEMLAVLKRLVNHEAQCSGDCQIGEEGQELPPCIVCAAWDAINKAEGK